MINETLPKSTLERIYRRIRRTGQKARKIKSPTVAQKRKDMVGKITPKKSADNDPHSPWVESVLFVLNNLGNKQAFQESDDPGPLLDIIDYLIAIQLGGWEPTEEGFVNKSGRVVSEENWNLDNGKLVAKSNSFRFDTDQLHEIRKLLEDKLQEEVDG